MRIWIGLTAILISSSVFSLHLKANAPSQYIVKPGDTLWSISSQYLESPWEWPSLWKNNPNLKNPNTLYPGAILVLKSNHQRPYLHVQTNGTIKLSPHMHRLPEDNPVPPIPLSVVKPFLDGSLVLDRNILKCAPYVLAFQGEHLIGGQGDEVYVKNLCPSQHLRIGETFSYAIFRPAGKYYNAKRKEVLGYKATLIGYAEYVRGKDPATVRLTNITEGVRLKDKLLPNQFGAFDLNFYPTAPTMPIQGRIIDLQEQYTQGSMGMIVVLDIGQNVGLKSGDVLAVYSRGRVLQDPNHPKRCIPLPNERLGEVMIFKTFTQTSFALVMRATRSIQKKDFITNP